MHSIRLGLFIALAPFALATGCESGGESFTDHPTVAIPAQGPSPVTVVNTESSPVPTAAVGTTAVAGDVGASQRGDWRVTVDNAALTVQGAVGVTGGTVGAAQAGAWTVEVGALPPVQVAPGASVAVTSLPPVSLAGQPTVTVAGTPTVTVAGTPSVAIVNTPSVNVAGAVAVANAVAVRPAGVRWAIGAFRSLCQTCLFERSVPTAVPAGKRLVVRRVSITANTFGDAQWASAFFEVNETDGGQVSVYLPFSPGIVVHDENGSDLRNSVASAEMEIIVEAGETVNYGCLRSAGTGGASCQGSIIGTLIDAP